MNMPKTKKDNIALDYDKKDDLKALPSNEGDYVEYLPREKDFTLLPSASTKDLVTYDALKAYISKIKQYPRLTHEEEEKLMKAYKENNDLEAAYKLISGNLWLVVKIARNYDSIARNLLDIIQEGNIGLMEAVKNFDVNKGTNFPSYAVFWIKAYIIRYIMANIRLVKIGTTQAQRKLFFNLQKEKEKLESQGFYPSTKLLAERLNVKEQEVIEMDTRLHQQDLSLSAPVGDDAKEEYENLIPSKEKNAEDILAQKQFNDLIIYSFNKFKETLNEKEAVIFEKRMLRNNKPTLEELSLELKISKERVRQIENEIKVKLKKFLSENFKEVANYYIFK